MKKRYIQILVVLIVAIFVFLGVLLLKHNAPGKYGSQVEFRMLAEIGKDGLTKETAEAYKTGPIPMEWMWAPWHPSTDRKIPESAVAKLIGNRMWVLVSKNKSYSLVHYGEEQWGLKNVKVVENDFYGKGTSYIRVNIKFDKVGAKLISELSKRCMERKLTVLINEEVWLAPTIQSKLGNSIEITIGIVHNTKNESEMKRLKTFREEANELCEALRK